MISKKNKRNTNKKNTKKNKNLFLKTKKSFKSIKKNTNEQRDENIDNLGIPNIDVFAKNPQYKYAFKCFYNQYNSLKNTLVNYKQYYKSYESGQQFKALVTIAFKYEPTVITRLLEIVLKKFNPVLTNILYNIIISKKSDKEIYEKLNKLYQNPNNRFNAKKKILAETNNEYCRGYVPIQESLLYDINKSIRYNNKEYVINKYLDIGCGNGGFAISLGKLLKLEKDNIFGVDVSNFSEQGDWGREKVSDKFVFKELQLNKPYPFEDNTFELITIKMVLHHIKNIDFTLKEIKRILKKNGFLLIIEHDSFTYADYMINDIEHGCYINVFKSNTFNENFLNFTLTKKNKKNENKISIDVEKYYSWPELTYMVLSYGFKYQVGRPYSNSIAETISGSRSIFILYKLDK